MLRITYSMVEQLTGRSTPVQFNNYAAGSLWCDPTPSIADNTMPPPGNRDLFPLYTLSVLKNDFAGEKVNLIWEVEYKYYYPARSQISITYYQPRERFKKLTIEIFFNAMTLFICITEIIVG